MSAKKTRQELAFDDLNELLGYYALDSKNETLASQLGLLMGWMSRLAATDWTVHQELESRLNHARQKHLVSKGISKPPVHRP